MSQVAESEVFSVTREFAYHAFLLFFHGPNGHPEFSGKGSRPAGELRELLPAGRPVVTEWEYPKTFTVDQLNGPVVDRTVMRFVGIASRTVVVSWGFSLHPQNFLGSVLTAIPRMRMRKAAPAIRATLWRLKVDCEGHAFDDVMKRLMGPEPLSELDPPEGSLRTVTDAAVWHRGMTLLEAAAYFAVLREELGPAADQLGQLSEELLAAGRLHLLLASDGGVLGGRLDAVRRAYAENFARLALSEHGYDQELLSSMMIYFMSLKKSLAQLGGELPRMNEQAAGSRTAMAEMLLEYASPDFEEMNRIAQGMPAGDTPLIFRQWAERRRAGADATDAAERPSSTGSGAPPMQEIELACEWCDSGSLMRELAPYVGDGVTFELRHRGPRFRGGEIDSTVLVALVAGGSAVVSSLVTGIIQWLATKREGKIVLKSSSGTTVEAPGDSSNERLRELAEIARSLDRPRIDIM